MGNWLISGIPKQNMVWLSYAHFRKFIKSSSRET